MLFPPPIWRICIVRQIGSSPRVGVKIKNVSNHHMAITLCKELLFINQNKNLRGISHPNDILQDTVAGRNPAPPVIYLWKPRKKWQILHINWYRVPSINSIIFPNLEHHFFWKRPRISNQSDFFAGSSFWFAQRGSKFFDLRLFGRWEKIRKCSTNGG